MFVTSVIKWNKNLFTTIRHHYHSHAMANTVALNNGMQMPIVGLGTWQSSKSDVQGAVRTALDVGYRLIDTAYSYKNEDAIGEVLQEYIGNRKVNREEFFIVTKLPVIHMDPSMVMKSLEMSLKKLRLPWVDLYLIHIPTEFKYVGDDDDTFPKSADGELLLNIKSNLVQTWKAMEACVDKGLTKSIGLSNFNAEQVQRICKNSRIRPVTNQVECNAYFQQKELYDHCKNLGITLTAYAPIGSPGRPDHFKTCEIPSLLDDTLIKKIAEKHGKTPAQVLIRNLMQRNIIVIPKSTNPDRVRQNFQVFDFQLSNEEMNEIANMKQQKRVFKMSLLDKHPEYPFHD